MGINEIYSSLVEGLELTFSYFTNPEKRIYILYLFSSAALAFYVYYRSKARVSFLRYLFPKKIWLGKSAVIDYLMIVFNSFVKIILIGPYLIIGLYIAFYVNEYLIQYFGYPTQSIGQATTLIFYTIALTIVGDFTIFLIHWIMHKIPFLWAFHKVHHSATELNPITQFRIHPVELLINNARGILVFGVLTGFFDYWSAHQVETWMFLGVNVFSFVFLFFGANLRHSHVKLKYPVFLERILISPFQHQIHHSNNPVHYNKNLGSKFAIWDWMFGTLILSKKVKQLQFGLGEEDRQFNTFWKNVFQPFRHAFLAITRFAQK